MRVIGYVEVDLFHFEEHGYLKVKPEPATGNHYKKEGNRSQAFSLHAPDPFQTSLLIFDLMGRMGTSGGSIPMTLLQNRLIFRKREI